MTRGDIPLIGAVVLLIGLGGCSHRQLPIVQDSVSPSSSSAGPLDGKTVLIDAGHNGGNADHPEIINDEIDAVTGDKACDTTGTQTDDGYFEHEFTFDVATRLAADLAAAGATVITTRDSDDGVGPCVTERAAIGNDAHADAGVSIHADGGPPDGRGFHIMEPVLIADHTEDIVEPSHELAKSIAQSYQEDTRIPASDYIGDNGINPRNDMAGMNLSTIPKVMVECGNMRNSSDAKILKDEESRQAIADAIAAGITGFLLQN